MDEILCKNEYHNNNNNNNNRRSDLGQMRFRATQILSGGHEFQKIGIDNSIKQYDIHQGDDGHADTADGEIAETDVVAVLHQPSGHPTQGHHSKNHESS